MNCPFCGSNQVEVADSRRTEENVFRRRRCLTCNQIFKTREIYESRYTRYVNCAKQTAYNEAISAIERLKNERTAENV